MKTNFLEHYKELEETIPILVEVTNKNCCPGVKRANLSLILGDLFEKIELPTETIDSHPEANYSILRRSILRDETLSNTQKLSLMKLFMSL